MAELLYDMQDGAERLIFQLVDTRLLAQTAHSDNIQACTSIVFTFGSVYMFPSPTD